MLKGFGGGWTLGWIIGEHFLCKINGQCTNSRISFLAKVEFTNLNCIHGLKVRSASEWWFALQEDKTDHSKRPDIALLAIAVFEHLRRHKIGRPDGLLQNLSLLIGERASEPNHFDLIKRVVLLKQHIFRLQIPVNNIMAVAVADTIQKLAHDLSYIFFIKLLPLNDLRKQLTAMYLFTDQVKALIVFIDLINF